MNDIKKIKIIEILENPNLSKNKKITCIKETMNKNNDDLIKEYNEKKQTLEDIYKSLFNVGDDKNENKKNK